jgi:hypothetical protein
VDPRGSLGDVEKRKFLTLSGLELRPLGRPARREWKGGGLCTCHCAVEGLGPSLPYQRYYLPSTAQPSRQPAVHASIHNIRDRRVAAE